MKKASLSALPVNLFSRYRFVSEPFEIGKIDVFFDHICGSLLYLLVQNNIDAEIDKKSDQEDTILIKSVTETLSK